ncbi:MAG TPA: GNAT family N-acetyltransferase [Blastocatellia bacterium]|nr:GNAT family N-acetyltransferase [Blastocatellia bacterium]
MKISVQEVGPQQVEPLFPLLLLAEPSESALRWSLANISDTVYEIRLAGEVVGAATMRWQAEPSEIVELAVAPDRQGRGIGKQIVGWLIDEARRRGKQQMIVGTANSSIDNIVFYQRCGFRMDHVRKDYFWYYDEPIIEDGIRVRDMLVFRYEIAESVLGF